MQCLDIRAILHFGIDCALHLGKFRQGNVGGAAKLAEGAEFEAAAS